MEQIFDAEHGLQADNGALALAGMRPREGELAPALPDRVTRASFLARIDLCVRYLAAWLSGSSPRQLDDAGVAESARVQLWKWLHCEDVLLDDGTPIDFTLFDTALQRVGERLPRRGLPGQENLMTAALMLAELTHARALTEFLVPPACAHGL
jgi:malate synthase